MKSDSGLLKFISLGAIAYFLWDAWKKGNGTLAGNPEGWRVRVDSDKAVDLLAHPFGLHPHAVRALKSGARALSGGLGRYGIERGRL